MPVTITRHPAAPDYLLANLPELLADGCTIRVRVSYSVVTTFSLSGFMTTHGAERCDRIELHPSPRVSRLPISRGIAPAPLADVRY